MHYVYLLKSKRGDHRYIGSTIDLRERLQRHNAGRVPQTADHRPWIVQTYYAFSKKNQATAFEPYQTSTASPNALELKDELPISGARHASRGPQFFLVHPSDLCRSSFFF